MPLVPAKCTSCGANLKVNSENDAAVCPYCKTAFIVEKAINNYITNNVTNIDHLHADVVNVTDEKSCDSRVKARETYIKLGEFHSAEMGFEKLSEECPYDYRAWLGLIQVKSKNFS